VTHTRESSAHVLGGTHSDAEKLSRGTCATKRNGSDLHSYSPTSLAALALRVKHNNRPQPSQVMLEIEPYRFPLPTDLVMHVSDCVGYSLLYIPGSGSNETQKIVTSACSAANVVALLLPEAGSVDTSDSNLPQPNRWTSLDTTWLLELQECARKLPVQICPTCKTTYSPLLARHACSAPRKR